jgi:hypothetical protein
MTRRLLHRLTGLLQRPILGTRVVPRDARLNLNLLPEEEFPIVCEKCGYLLRGLPECRCPECGTDFDRGALLLRQYVHKWFDGMTRTTATGRVIRWLCWTGVALVVLNLTGLLAVGLGGQRVLKSTRRVSAMTLSKGVEFLKLIEHLLWLIELLLLVCILAGLAWASNEIRKRLRKRRRVIEAVVDQGSSNNE